MLAHFKSAAFLHSARSGRSIGSDPLVTSAFVRVQPHSVTSSPLSITQRAASAMAVPESAPLRTSPG